MTRCKVSLGLWAVGVSWLLGPVALGCQLPGGPGAPVVVQVRFGSLQVPWEVNLTWPDLQTRAAEPGTVCALGLRAGPFRQVLDLRALEHASGLPFEPLGSFAFSEPASQAAAAQFGGQWFVFTAPLKDALPAGVGVDDAWWAVVPPGTTFSAITAAYARGPVFLVGQFDPRASRFVPERVQVVGAERLSFLAGVARYQPTEALSALACDPNVHANRRRAAAAGVASRWLEGPPAQAELFRYSTDPTLPPECRAMGFEAQVAGLFSEGDPRLGEPLSQKSAQRYADAVATAPTPERAYLLATGVARLLREGFAVVPGGIGESFRRLQTCLAGSIRTSEHDLVLGVRLDCGLEAVRRAIGDSIATSFYAAFRENPFVNLTCDDLKVRAQDPHATVAARWAAAKALVFDARCTASTVEALTDLTLRATSPELKQAAVRPLAERLALGGGDPRSLLFNASNAATAELRQAYGWAAGVVLSSARELAVDPSCRATTRPTGPLDEWAAANIDGHSEPGLAAIAPLARYGVFQLVEVNRGTFCSLQRTDVALRLKISRSVAGARLPLESFLSL